MCCETCLYSILVKFPAPANVSEGFPAKSEGVQATEGPVLVLKRIFLFLHPNFLVPRPAKQIYRCCIAVIRRGAPVTGCIQVSTPEDTWRQRRSSHRVHAVPKAQISGRVVRGII